MGALIREGGLRSTDKAIGAVTKRFIETQGIPAAIKALDRKAIKVIWDSSTSHVLASRHNPLTRIVNARLAQLGVRPASALVGALQAHLLQKAGFEQWRMKLREDKFDDLWKITVDGLQRKPEHEKTGVLVPVSDEARSEVVQGATDLSKIQSEGAHSEPLGIKETWSSASTSRATCETRFQPAGQSNLGL